MACCAEHVSAQLSAAALLKALKIIPLSNFAVGKRIGSGAFANVYIAQGVGPDRTTGKLPVALKCLLPHLSASKDDIKLFFREAILLSGTEHGYRQLSVPPPPLTTTYTQERHEAR